MQDPVFIDTSDGKAVVADSLKPKPVQEEPNQNLPEDVNNVKETSEHNTKDQARRNDQSCDSSRTGK